MNLRIVNPADGSLVRELPVDSPGDIRAKAAAARAARPEWERRPAAERGAALSRFAKAVEREQDRLAGTLTREMGKPITQARNELRALGGRLRFFLDHFEEALRPERVRSEAGLDEEIGYEPLGLVANISAWNYPYFVGSNVFVPALLTGNAVLYKPSEHAALTGLAIGELLREAGVPAEVFPVVVGAGAAGAALLEEPLDAVFFTGSYATGRRVCEAAARRLMKVQLELGGKDPAYVAEDADPAQAGASLADGAFYNAGQSCCAVERIYAHAGVYDAFLESFLATARSFRVGDPLDEGTYLGPLARQEQLAVLEAQVADALAKGARLALGGKRLDRPGNFFAPTVLTGVDHAMALMREESFGPVIGVMKVGSDDEAARLMADTEYGLTAGVYSADEARARRILARVNAGTAYWNCCDRVSPFLPWSGRGHSGLGVTLSKEGIRTFLRPKAWHLRRP